MRLKFSNLEKEGREVKFITLIKKINILLDGYNEELETKNLTNLTNLTDSEIEEIGACISHLEEIVGYYW